MNLDKLCDTISEMKPHSDRLKDIIEEFNDIIIIGNGGSNAIASHISQDYTKILGKRALSFSDGSRLTCYINDYGRDTAYTKFLEHFANKETLIILISSSGNSMNIVNAALFCKWQDYNYIVLSGFDKDNKLNKMEGPTMKYWVNSTDYGEVECSHEIFLHSII